MKKILKKEFTQTHLDDCSDIKKLAKEKFNLSPVNNICLILQKLKVLSNTDGDYVECGTYRGNTLLPAALYSSSKGYFQKKKLIGVDTFEGFPLTDKHDFRDIPNYFTVLRSKNLISEEHFNKAKIRTNNFNDLSHLENEYFLDTKEVFENCSKFNNIELLKGTFESVLPTFNKKISVLHLDGDLYHSYLTCLNNLYDNVINEGAIIFDEYYSCKYPGARVAVDEFFENKKGYFEQYITEEGHERWCFIKQENE